MSKKFYLVLVLLLVPFMILTACDGGGTTTTTSSTSTTSTTTTTTSTTTSTTSTTTTTTTTTTTSTTTTTPPVFTLTSTSFADGAAIPTEYSLQGGNKSPQFSWSGAPEDTVSFVLIMEDIDAGTDPDFFCHWIVFNIPADVFELAENQPATATLANGATQGTNHFSMIGWGGPDPPPGDAHHYRFRLYALDTTLDLTSVVMRDQVLNAITGHILGQVDYTGTYAFFGNN
jgi:Raf kinase inhibitor-like YbhB/YbcL family protein